MVQTAAISTIASQLNRRLLAKEAEAAPAPAWIKALNDDREVSPAQIDSLYYRLIFTLSRLARENINTRTDGLVMDIAEYSGVWRSQARDFLQKILTEVIADIATEQGALRLKINAAATETGVDGDKALRMVELLCRRTLQVYVESKAKLSADDARSLLLALTR